MPALWLCAHLLQTAAPPANTVEIYWAAQLARGAASKAGSGYVPLRDGIIEAQAGDRIQFYLSPRADVYAYLLHKGTDGAIERLLPTTSSALIAAGTPLYLPGKGRWYELEGKAGSELIILLVSRTRLNSLEDRLRDAGNGPVDTRAAARAVLDEITRLRAAEAQIDTHASRPLAIAGRFRATEPDAAALAQPMTAERLLARSYIIERK